MIATFFFMNVTTNGFPENLLINFPLPLICNGIIGCKGDWKHACCIQFVFQQKEIRSLLGKAC